MCPKYKKRRHRTIEIKDAFNFFFSNGLKKMIHMLHFPPSLLPLTQLLLTCKE